MARPPTSYRSIQHITAIRASLPETAYRQRQCRAIPTTPNLAPFPSRSSSSWIFVSAQPVRWNSSARPLDSTLRARKSTARVIRRQRTGILADRREYSQDQRAGQEDGKSESKSAQNGSPGIAEGLAKAASAEKESSVAPAKSHTSITSRLLSLLRLTAPQTLAGDVNPSQHVSSPNQAAAGALPIDWKATSFSHPRPHLSRSSASRKETGRAWASRGNARSLPAIRLASVTGKVSTDASPVKQDQGLSSSLRKAVRSSVEERKRKREMRRKLQARQNREVINGVENKRVINPSEEEVLSPKTGADTSKYSESEQAATNLAPAAPGSALKPHKASATGDNQVDGSLPEDTEEGREDETSSHACDSQTGLSSELNSELGGPTQQSRLTTSESGSVSDEAASAQSSPEEIAAKGTLKANMKELRITPVKPLRNGQVAKLARGLDRVLFNPPVYFLRDPNSLVYNFDPRLENIPKAEEFAFDRLPAYITASQDKELHILAKQNGLKFYGSTSTLTTALSQIYFLISGHRPIDITNFSSAFSKERKDFTAGAKLPASLWLRAMPDGKYAVDNEKSWDVAEENVLSDLGKVMEKMLTSELKDFKRFLKTAPDSAVSTEEREERETYHYCKGSSLLMRSQLDCHDPRLPGNGTFDIKTRAAMVIRHDRANHEENSRYDIYQLLGLQESFEKEYYDMARSAFLKYSMQVRIGGMNGIFVAYHNTARIFGFQYIPLREMDRILHGSSEMGEQAFRFSVHLLESVFKEATETFPDQTLNVIISNASDSLVVTAQPEAEPGQSTRNIPAVRFTLKIRNILNGQLHRGPVDFHEVSAKAQDVDWKIEYELSKTALDAQGIAQAHAAIETVQRKFSQMASLVLPEGKTPEDMRKASDQKDEASEESNSGRTVKWRSANGHIQKLRSLARESGANYLKRIAAVKGKKQVVWKRD